jgi:hypothetical protein
MLHDGGQRFTTMGNASKMGNAATMGNASMMSNDFCFIGLKSDHRAETLA